MSSEQDPRPSELAAARRLALFMAAALAALVSGAVVAVFWMASAYDDLGRSSAERMIADGLRDFETSLAITTEDYAVWTAGWEAARAGDRPWLTENMGSGVYDGEGVIADLFVIFEPGGATEYGWTEETGAEPTPGLLDPSALAVVNEAFDAAPDTFGEALTLYVRSRGEVWLLAAIRMTPTEGALDGVTDAETPRFVSGRKLTPERLQALGEKFLISGAVLSDAAPGDGLDGLIVPGPAGAPLAWIVWEPPASGADILEMLLPPALAALLAAALAGWLVTRRMLAATERLQGALFEAEAADRAKTAFLSNVSHELRTPMNGVMGIAQLLRLRAAEAESGRLIDVLMTSARHQLALINDILEMARMEGGARRLAEAPFDPSAELLSVVAMLRPEAEEKGLALFDSEVEETGEVTGDPLAFRQIAVNLIGNALKFTDAGHVRVGLSAVRNGALVLLRLEVADTGPGVPEASRARIFRRFERGEAAERGGAGGVGLGLSITRSLVEMMDGSVEVSEAPEGGALFSVIVSLPASGAEAKAEAA